MAPLAALAGILGVLALATSATAGNVSCTAYLYVKPKAKGALFTFKTSFLESKVYAILDLSQIAPIKKVPTWDDKTQSGGVNCRCIRYSCKAADFSKATLRLFADPFWKKTGGGAFFDIPCNETYPPKSPFPKECIGRFDTMPTGWDNQTSAAAILYDSPHYKLPTERPADDISACDLRAGYAVYSNTAWFVTDKGTVRDARTPAGAQAACDADPKCIAWNTRGLYTYGKITRYDDAEGVCTYVKKPARRVT